MKTARRIQIHWSFILFAVIMIAFGQALTFLLLVISVTVHELSHVICVRRFGGQIKALRLTAMGEAAVVSGLEEMTVAARYAVYFAGPLASLCVALLMVIFGLRSFAALNLLIGLFNLCPVFPLDGGRIAQLFLWNRFGILKSDRLLSHFGRIIGWLMILIGGVYTILFPCNITFVCVGMYIKEWNKRTLLPLTLEFYRLIAGKPQIHRDKRRILPVRFIAVYADTPVSRLIERVNLDCLTHVLVDGDPEQLMPEQDYVDYILENGLNGTAGLVYNEIQGHNVS
jgi:stage IV sporulation protein FB